MEQKTPLYRQHLAAGGKMVPFAGWLLPVQYTGVIQEHRAVREQAGLFDVSHMGELRLTGPQALQNLNRLCTNDFTGMDTGRVRYSPLCNQAGGVIDDLLVYKRGEEDYLLVVNAANREKDLRWMQEHIRGDAVLRDISGDLAQIALQGPRAPEVLSALTPQLPARYYSFLEDCEVAGVRCLVSRTGYTGEVGYELYCAPDGAPALWEALLEAGGPHGLVPCGLGARDTLRLEAAMPLYDHEMDETLTPLETGLHFSVKLGKPEFIGREALLQQGEPAITRVGLRLTGRGIAREHCPVWQGEEQVGRTTSGTHCPWLGGAYAMALIGKAHAAPGTGLEVEVRGRRIAAQVVPLPFYKAGQPAG